MEILKPFAVTTIGALSMATFANAATPKEVVSEACLSGQQSAAYCKCYASEFETLASQLTSNDAALFLTTFAGGMSVLGTTETTRLHTETSISDRTQALAFLPQLNAARATCEAREAVIPAADTAGAVSPPQNDAIAEFVTVCEADGDSDGACACVGRVFQTHLTEDEFKIMTVSQAANSKGENPMTAIGDAFGVDQSGAMAMLSSFAPKLAVVSQERADDLANCAP